MDVLGSSVDWTQVLVALIAGLPATLAVALSYMIHRQIRTPSGERIGKLTEQTNHLQHAQTEILMDVHRQTTGAEDALNGEA